MKREKEKSETLFVFVLRVSLVPVVVRNFAQPCSAEVPVSEFVWRTRQSGTERTEGFSTKQFVDKPGIHSRIVAVRIKIFSPYDLISDRTAFTTLHFGLPSLVFATHNNNSNNIVNNPTKEYPPQSARDCSVKVGRSSRAELLPLVKVCA